MSRRKEAVAKERCLHSSKERTPELMYEMWTGSRKKALESQHAN